MTQLPELYEPESPPLAGDEPTELCDATREHFEAMVQTQAALVLEIQDLKAQDRLLLDLQEQCRRHREQFFEREVLGPVIQGLISVADRCRQDVRRLKRQPRGRGVSGWALVAEYVQQREADLAEVHGLLAIYGVEPFQHPEERFAATLQSCRQRVPCDSEKHGAIAGRLLPGYRRGEHIVRREIVKVYIATPTA